MQMNLPSVKWDSSLGRVLFQLVVGTGTESVSAHQTSLPVFLHIVVRKLGAGGGLT